MLGVILMIAVYYDYRQSRIPNFLCLAGIAAGMIEILIFHGMRDGCSRFLWAGGLFLCFFPLWLWKAVGGGDVKLLVTAGLLLGRDSVSFLLCAGICIGIHALGLMVIRKNYFKRLTLFFRYVMECVEQKRMMPYPFDSRRDGKDGGIRISYGLLAGHLLAVLTGIYRYY